MCSVLFVEDVDELEYFTVANLSLSFVTEVNECLEKNRGGCEQGCINKQGGYECFCGNGFLLNDDGKTCSGMSGPLNVEIYNIIILNHEYMFPRALL